MTANVQEDVAKYIREVFNHYNFGDAPMDEREIQLHARVLVRVVRSYEYEDYTGR